MNVLVVVSASIAAVKAPALLRRLREAGFAVRVIATRSALEFITELSLATAADGPVHTDTGWFAAQPGAQHLELARFADLTVVVSASADLMARAAHGRADDLAAATLLCVRGPVLWVPAMNPSMWEHPATAANRARLEAYGHTFLGPVFGRLGTRGEGEGFGRMAEPERIVLEVQRLLSLKDLAGRHVLVTAGPTREYLDPVRFISNPSSGKMGFAVAERALARGARVTLVSGPSHLEAPPGAELVRVESALEMQAACEAAWDSVDIGVLTAAVADYRAAQRSGEKQAKAAGPLSVELVPNPDIAAGLGARKGARVLVGFAMETHAGVERAAGKASRKNLDFILLNYPTREGSGFGGDDNEVTLVTPSGEAQAWPRLSKLEVADRLLDQAVAGLRAKQQPV
ncbi:phosphopantothenoylcysteine decarboxylase/phosphopantothenate--cysteine ligase [Deinobacterium chartae]|uniref:Coenzyme A biosynthesis bifunctional protein CoaBC n=1 Tax=Deinobacterium chartae TaxID=521158 RepID=A0A841I4K0_9DEIO|nr:bifunctional phosphopantothenoylcysteine decarboxylase/phosphopantothenate--cysteine ligase CoaBC [Deinobacterium chartae]MBB6098815.1 phosphopantothenoylcysteine decarboxylase/phosphopantothenate--cysteine ligase [Deinobacterium chartae]